jgi:hypothetical protein
MSGGGNRPSTQTTHLSISNRETWVSYPGLRYHNRAKDYRGSGETRSVFYYLMRRIRVMILFLRVVERRGHGRVFLRKFSNTKHFFAAPHASRLSRLMPIPKSAATHCRQLAKQSERLLRTGTRVTLTVFRHELRRSSGILRGPFPCRGTWW